jgi:hypothetical protein
MPPIEGWAMDDTWDAIILSAASERWQKVARIIAVVSERTGNGKHFDAIAARIRALVDDGKFEAKGDLSRWRYSEVRRARQGPVGRVRPTGPARSVRPDDRLQRNPPYGNSKDGGLRFADPRYGLGARRAVID